MSAVFGIADMGPWTYTFEAFWPILGEQFAWISSWRIPAAIRTPRFARSATGGGLVVLAGRAEVKVLNPVGIAVFSLLDGSRDVETLAAAVADEFDVDPDRAREEVREFLIELQSAGLLAEEPPEDGRSY